MPSLTAFLDAEIDCVRLACHRLKRFEWLAVMRISPTNSSNLHIGYRARSPTPPPPPLEYRQEMHLYNTWRARHATSAQHNRGTRKKILKAVRKKATYFYISNRSHGGITEVIVLFIHLVAPCCSLHTWKRLKYCFKFFGGRFDNAVTFEA